MTSEDILRSANVLIKHGRVISLRAKSVEVRSAALRLNGAGKYLIPGLADGHVHLPTSVNLREAMCDLLIANGVTHVVDLAGASVQLRFREDVREGRTRGPSLYVSGPPLGDPHGHNTVTSANEIERSVLAYKREGYDLIKLRGDLSLEAYRRLNSVAQQKSIKVVGHAPRNLGVQRMLDERQDAVAHIEEYLYAYFYYRRNIEAPPLEINAQTRWLAERTAAAGTTVITTLAVFRGIPEQISDLEQVLNRAEVQRMPMSLGTLWNWWAPGDSYRSRFGVDRIPWFERQYRIMTGMALAFQRAGVRLVAGTDTPTPAMVPGFSIHDELHELVKAGLSPYQALRSATVNPGAFLHASSDFGTIEVGKRANLVLLTGNPLENISHTRHIDGVILQGQWYSKQALQQFARFRRVPNSTRGRYPERVKTPGPQAVSAASSLGALRLGTHWALFPKLGTCEHATLLVPWSRMDALPGPSSRS
jgi:hypothetical protein